MKHRLVAALAAAVVIGGSLAAPAEAKPRPENLTPKLCATYNTEDTTAVFTTKTVWSDATNGIKTCTRTTIRTLPDDSYIEYSDDGFSADYYTGTIHYNYVETQIFYFTQKGHGPIEDNFGTINRTGAREYERLCTFTKVDPETGAWSNAVDVPISECASRGLYT